MSYCRVSAESDIYCYPHVSGDYMIHVIGSRGLPSDGKSFVDTNLYDLYRRLLQLREEGYLVPGYAFKRIENEMVKEGS
jgi:hypothetical protein